MLSSCALNRFATEILLLQEFKLRGQIIRCPVVVPAADIMKPSQLPAITGIFSAPRKDKLYLQSHFLPHCHGHSCLTFTNKRNH